MSRRSRRVHDDAFKARVALEALKEQKTIAEIASEYDIHPNQVSTWKSELLAKSAQVFSGNKNQEREIEELKAERAKLHERIGQQAMELDFVKKNCKKLGLL